MIDRRLALGACLGLLACAKQPGEINARGAAVGGPFTLTSADLQLTIDPDVGQFTALRHVDGTGSAVGPNFISPHSWGTLYEIETVETAGPGAGHHPADRLKVTAIACMVLRLPLRPAFERSANGGTRSTARRGGPWPLAIIAAPRRR